MAMLVPEGRRPVADADRFERGVGGAESNVAMGLARLGVPSRWLSRVGDDGLGRHLVRTIAAAGVDTSCVERDPLRQTGVYFKDFDGPTTRVHYYREGSAAAAMSPAWFQPGWIAGAELLHLTGITPALSSECHALIAMLLEAAPRPVPISLDVNWRPALWRDADASVLTGLAGRADIVFVGDDEAVALWGSDDPGVVRERLADPAEVVLKHGARGATLLHPGGRCFVPALTLAHPVVDAVGAGDQFAAGYLAGRLAGLDPARRLRMGHIMGATVLSTSADVGPRVPQARIDALLGLDDGAWAATRWAPDGQA
jgi:2-dehydro-3-deoxygluconokinase